MGDDVGNKDGNFDGNDVGAKLGSRDMDGIADGNISLPSGLSSTSTK